MTLEYKVVPAPTRGRKARGVKTAADRFALALETVINELARDGWQYLRTDTLPAEIRQGFTGKATIYQNMLVFCRTAEAPASTEPAEAKPADATAPKVAPEAPAKPSAGSTLNSMIEQEIAAARAPKLPTAKAAQEVPVPATKPIFTASRRNLAAE